MPSASSIIPTATSSSGKKLLNVSSNVNSGQNSTNNNNLIVSASEERRTRRVNNCNNNHSLCICLNIQGMCPSLRSKSFWKVNKLTEDIDKLSKKGTPVSFLAIAETWLKNYITDAQVSIPNYNVFRADRTVSKNGGALLYVHDSIVVDNFSSFDDDTCSGVICLSTQSSCFIACVYRPPSASVESFSNLLIFISEFINAHNKLDKMKIFLFGDFNFPKISWEEDKITVFSTPSENNLKSFTDKYFLTQYIRENTRLTNILDLIFTDDVNFVQHIEINNTDMSDHDVIKIHTLHFSDFDLNTDEITPRTLDFDFSRFKFYNCNFDNINRDFSDIDWESIISGPIDSIPHKFKSAVFTVLQKHCKLKSKHKRNKNSTSFYRKRRIISRKISKYKKRLNYPNCNPKTRNILLQKIAKLQDNKKQSLLDEKISTENQAVENIKNNSNFFSLCEQD